MAPPLNRPSPNFGERRADATGACPIDMLVLHYTDMDSAETSLSRLCDPAAQVSAHYLIDEEGSLYALVTEEARAWHAGLAYWRGCADVNSRSIGIELQNPGHSLGYRAFPEAQIARLIDLASGILARHPIPTRNVLAHSDIAPDRKLDPGELFPWAQLATAGIGVWPEGDSPGDPGSLKDSLAQIGYDPQADQAIAAFQRRFRTSRIDNQPDPETACLAQAYLRLCEACPT